MQKDFKLNDIDLELFKSKLLSFGNKFRNFAFLNSNQFNHYNTPYTCYDYDFLAAIDSKYEINSLQELKERSSNKHEWLFGYLTYDLKNKIENLESNNIDEINFPELNFFCPEILVLAKKSEISVLYNDSKYSKDILVKTLISSEKSDSKSQANNFFENRLKKRFSISDYVDTVNKIKDHIQKGDIYEANFCQEFYCIKDIDPIQTYLKLNKISPTPFSCLYKLNGKYLLSASPERFLKKVKSKVISQPIKGTIKRGKNKSEDLKLKEQLLNDPKERAENVMIVDLVRNDLSRTAKKGSVKVEELWGIYSFKQVHQMISTVVSEVDEDTNIISIIENAFPMGSMTGAPKIRAMQLIEDYEKTKRGLYSGSVGFITPDNDFDFNVVIRSILYNQSKKYVSFTVGSAITGLSDPEKEYDECMVKAEAMLKALN